MKRAEQNTNFVRLTIIAQWLFAIAVLLLMFAWGTEWRTGNIETKSVFLYLHCGIVLFCLLIAASVTYFQTKYWTEAKDEFYKAFKCALWWTGTGTLYVFIFYILTIAGFIFLILAFFLWLETIRQAFRLRQAHT